MNRPGFILLIGLVFIGGTALNAVIPRATDSRRISLGSINDQHVGSILIPYGWHGQKYASEEDLVSVQISSHANAPSILARVTRDLKVPKQSSRTAPLLSQDVQSVPYYDISRNLTWNRDSGGGGKHMRVVNVQFHEPPFVNLRFTDVDNTQAFESTLIRIVDSYSKSPADPVAIQASGDPQLRKPPFVLTDLRRRYHAVWIVGAMTILLSLVIIERNLDAKLQREFQEELQEHSRSMPRIDAEITEPTPVDELTDSGPSSQRKKNRTDWQALALEKGGTPAQDKPQRPTIPFDDD